MGYAIERMKYSAFFIIIFYSSLIPSFTKAQKTPDHDTTYYVTYPDIIVSRFYFSKKYEPFTIPATILSIGKVTLSAENEFQFIKRNVSISFSFS